MSHGEFAEKVNMNEKTLCSVITRKSCPDIWFMAMTKEVLRYDCTQMLYHYNSLANTKALTEKELAVLKMIREGDKEDQDRKLDVITAFLRYNTGDNRILGKAIPDIAPSMMGSFDNTSTRKKAKRNQASTTAQTPAEPVSSPVSTPLPVPQTEPVPEISRTSKNNIESKSQQVYFDFYDMLGENNNNS